MAARLVFVALALGLFGSACSSSSNQKVPIGSACTKASDCGTSPYLCLTKTTVDDKEVDYPNGYCSLPCVVTSSDCPSDSICVVSECRRSCADASACRVDEGYACIPATASEQNPYCDYPAAL